MTTERMLELLNLTMVLNNMPRTRILLQYSYRYDVCAMRQRKAELEKEFLNPYVIDNAEKSE